MTNMKKPTTIWTSVRKSKDNVFVGSFSSVVKEIKSGNNFKGISFDSGKLGFVFGEEPKQEEVIEGAVPSISVSELKQKEFKDEQGFVHVNLEIACLKNMVEYAETQLGIHGYKAETKEQILQTAMAWGMKEIKKAGGLKQFVDKELPSLEDEALNHKKEVINLLERIMGKSQKKTDMSVEIAGIIKDKETGETKTLTGDEALNYLKDLLTGDDKDL